MVQGHYAVVCRVIKQKLKFEVAAVNWHELDRAFVDDEVIAESLHLHGSSGQLLLNLVLLLHARGLLHCPRVEVLVLRAGIQHIICVDLRLVSVGGLLLVSSQFLESLIVGLTFSRSHFFQL